MNENGFKIMLIGVALVFTASFCVLVIPPLIANPDLPGAFAAGFVNPYASGYSLDVILCWVVLAIWVTHEARIYNVRHGWVCVVLGVIPGVAVGLPLYMVLRSRQIKQVPSSAQHAT